MTTQPWLDIVRPLQVLVVDDDYRWRYLLVSNLESYLGTEPLLATGGAEALGILTQRPIDVVICDLLMPEMDGLEFLKKARSLFRRTKIILLSADFDAFPISPKRLIEQGALAAIPKTEISSTLIPMLQLLQEAPDMLAPLPRWGLDPATADLSLN